MKTYNKKSSKIDLYKLNEIQIYELVRERQLYAFPRNFFTCEESDNHCPIILRYFIEEILGFKDRDEVPQKIRKEQFKHNKLAGMLSIKYNSSPSEAVMKAYPERNYRPWEFHEAPNSYWSGGDGRLNGINATKWLFEEKLKWTKDDIKNGVSWQLFKDNGLGGMIKRGFNDSIWECIDTVYPGEFMHWEIGEHVPNEFWNIEKGTMAVKWLIEDRLKWSEQDIKDKLDKQIFIDNDLYGMIQRCFSASPYLAINSAYPGKYNPWELKTTPSGYWTLDNGAIAMKWLIEQKLNWGDKDIREKLSGTTLKENGFVTLAEKFTTYELINKVYPERMYMPWEIRATTPFGFWKEDTSIWATKWLIENKLSINIDEAYTLTKRTFQTYGISGVFEWFKGSVGDLINFVYRDEIVSQIAVKDI